MTENHVPAGGQLALKEMREGLRIPRQSLRSNVHDFRPPEYSAQGEPQT